MRKSTVGWKLCVQWRDGSTSWQELKDLEESHPVETAEYTMSQEIYHESEFKWWGKAVLNKTLKIIPLVKKRNTHYLKKTHKFWIEVTKSVAQAYAFDKNNGNTLWAYDIAK